MTVFGIQKRFMELGRVRLGEKGSKGEPRSIKTFRFTSASQDILVDVATAFGGTVSEWTDGPEGYYEVTSKTDKIQIVLPPMFAQDGQPSMPYSQFYELWSGGGCQRRCDGQTVTMPSESGKTLVEKPCVCDADDRECQITTRISFIIPEIRGFGVWRLDSKGWNAAAELPGTLELLNMAASAQRFIPATLRIEPRTSKKGGQTRKYVVPVLDLPGIKMGDMLPQSDGAEVVNAPLPRAPKPELPAGPEPPAEPKSTVETDDIDFGPPPQIPEGGSPAITGEVLTPPSSPDPPGLANDQQRRDLFDEKKAYGLTDDQFKDILEKITGKRSTQGLLAEHVDQILTQMAMETVA